MTGIYKITSPTSRVYVGQSVDIEKRWCYYRNRCCKNQRRLNHSFSKYGVDSHVFEIIEECSIDMLNERERYWQEQYNVLCVHKGLNSILVKTSNSSGVKSKETINKIKETFRIKGVVRGCNNPMYGRKHKTSSKIKMSKSAKGRKLSNDHILKISKNSTGYNNGRAKIVLNFETGVYYDYAKEGADSINMIHGTFHAKLNGKLKNTTSFNYV